MQNTNDRSKWAWDTSPTDGGPPRPIYIGNKEQWSIEETRKRRDTNRNPWGGVWTEAEVPGATKAKWGKRTFDSGRYRCCHDMHDCGLFVSVKQGVVNAWHFQRQWSWGKPRTYQYKCKNEAMYVGRSRFHHIVVNESYSMLSQSMEFDGKAIESITKEHPVVGLGGFEPDVYVKFEDGTWFAIEVILTSAPDRDKHTMFGKNLIEINLNDLDCLDNDRDFSRWIQQGGVSELLHAESTLEQRTQRWEARENKWKRKDEREFRKAFDTRMGVCLTAFGLSMDIQSGSITELEEVERCYEEELFRRLNNAQQQANHLQQEIEARVLEELGVVSEVLNQNQPIPQAATTNPTLGQVNAWGSNNGRAKSQSWVKKNPKRRHIKKWELRKIRKNLENIANNSSLTARKRRDAKWKLANLKSKYKPKFSKQSAGKVSSPNGRKRNR